MRLFVLLSLFAGLQLARSQGIFGWGKKAATELTEEPDGFADKADKLLKKKVKSDDLSANIKAAKVLLQDPKLEDGVRNILNHFVALRTSYWEFCDEQTFEQVRTMQELMVTQSKYYDWNERQYHRMRLSQLVAHSYHNLVNNCLSSYNKELKKVYDWDTEPNRYAVFESFKSFLPEEVPRGDLKSLWKELERTHFKELKRVTTKWGRSKWKKFMQQMSSVYGDELIQSLATSQDVDRVSEQQTLALFQKYVTNNCRPLLEGETGHVLSKSSDLLKWCELDTINYDAFNEEPRQPNLIELSVNYLVCKKLNHLDSDSEFIAKLSELINS